MGLFDRFKKKADAGKVAGAAEPAKKGAGGFVGFALLSDGNWDKEQFIRDLKEDWGISAKEDGDSDGNTLVFSEGAMMATLALMPAPVPGGEAEQNAASNYMWPQAVETAKSHQAHLLVAVLGMESDVFKKGELYVKLLSCCCKQKNALGIYTSGTVFEPGFYMAGAEMIKKGEMPLLNWIWFGLYRNEGGICCYTYGMEQFGKDEMEVLNAGGQPSDVRNFLLDLVSYVLDSDVILHDGETIGFSAEDKHTITRSEGVSMPGMTLKISY
ncbi:MAG: DUF4261 domain-containing protein [Methanocorpusculum sp.]|nr:DUF4261 domain-containing protein [Oscillospiraceae bacterium]MBQ3570273.1 DUF4261 domain-containing protein [Methanocorpusculum sp.]